MRIISFVNMLTDPSHYDVTGVHAMPCTIHDSPLGPSQEFPAEVNLHKLVYVQTSSASERQVLLLLDTPNSGKQSKPFSHTTCLLTDRFQSVTLLPWGRAIDHR